MFMVNAINTFTKMQHCIIKENAIYKDTYVITSLKDEDILEDKALKYDSVFNNGPYIKLMGTIYNL